MAMVPQSEGCDNPQPSCVDGSATKDDTLLHVLVYAVCSAARLAALVEMLERRAMRVIVLDHAAEVMAHLAVEDVDAVLIHDPAVIRPLPRLLNAIARCHPSVMCAGFEPADDGSGGQVVALEDYLRADGALNPGANPANVGDEDCEKPRLSSGELAMLLGEDGED